MKILLSIKPEFVEKIFCGEKKFEYRKVMFKNKSVQTVIIYSTMPVGRIVGEFKIRKIHKDNPNEIWRKTQKYSGVNLEFYNQYFRNREFGFAIEITDVILYDIPIDPKDIFDKFTAPQSFCYLSNFDALIADKKNICILRSSYPEN